MKKTIALFLTLVLTAAAFAACITGKTPAEVSGIALDESSAPTDADLVSSVTIKIGGFLELIGKAVQ